MKSILLFKIDDKGQGNVHIKGDIMKLGELVMTTMVQNESFAEIMKSAVKGYSIIKEREEKIKTPKLILP